MPKEKTKERLNPKISVKHKGKSIVYFQPLPKKGESIRTLQVGIPGEHLSIFVSDEKLTILKAKDASEVHSAERHETKARLPLDAHRARAHPPHPLPRGPGPQPTPHRTRP